MSMTAKAAVLTLCFIIVISYSYPLERKASVGKELLGGCLGFGGGIAVASLPLLLTLPFGSDATALGLGVSIGLIPFSTAYGTAWGIHKSGRESGYFGDAYKGSCLSTLAGLGIGVALIFLLRANPVAIAAPCLIPLVSTGCGVWFYERGKKRRVAKEMRLKLQTPTGPDEVIIEYEK